jgi:hypothetical protein
MKEWFTQLLSPTGTVSAKRFSGIIGIINIYVHSWVRPMTGEELTTHCLMVGGLLGVGAVVDILNKNKKDTKVG